MDRGNAVKWEEERGLLYSSGEPVLMAQSFYEGLRIRVGVFLYAWLVCREQNGTDVTVFGFISGWIFWFVCFVMFCIKHNKVSLYRFERNNLILRPYTQSSSVVCKMHETCWVALYIIMIWVYTIFFCSCTIFVMSAERNSCLNA